MEIEWWMEAEAALSAPERRARRRLRAFYRRSVTAAEALVGRGSFVTRIALVPQLGVNGLHDQRSGDILLNLESQAALVRWVASDHHRHTLAAADASLLRWELGVLLHELVHSIQMPTDEDSRGTPFERALLEGVAESFATTNVLSFAAEVGISPALFVAAHSTTLDGGYATERAGAEQIAATLAAINGTTVTEEIRAIIAVECESTLQSTAIARRITPAGAIDGGLEVRVIERVDETIYGNLLSMDDVDPAGAVERLVEALPAIAQSMQLTVAAVRAGEGSAEATRRAEEALRVDPLNQAAAALLLSRYPQPRAALDAVLELSPTFPDALALKAATVAGDDPDEAVRLAERALERTPLSATAWARAFRVLISQGRALPQPQVGKFVEWFPDTFDAVWITAMSAFLEGDSAAARRLAESLVERSGTDHQRAEAHSLRGMIAADLGDMEAAKREFIEVVRLAGPEGRPAVETMLSPYGDAFARECVNRAATDPAPEEPRGTSDHGR